MTSRGNPLEIEFENYDEVSNDEEAPSKGETINDNEEGKLMSTLHSCRSVVEWMHVLTRFLIHRRFTTQVNWNPGKPSHCRECVGRSRYTTTSIYLSTSWNNPYDDDTDTCCSPFGLVLHAHGKCGFESSRQLEL
jgi:hypothetical protein